MDTTIRLHHDFKEFLRLLKASDVEYLLVGGYAVGYYGYPRPTGDMDIWVSRNEKNAQRLVEVLNAFGFVSDELSAELFTLEKSIVRMGVPPYKLELITHIDGVEFSDCYSRRHETNVDDVAVLMIGLDDLKKNKRASGRAKDMNDLENLA